MQSNNNAKHNHDAGVEAKQLLAAWLKTEDQPTSTITKRTANKKLSILQPSTTQHPALILYQPNSPILKTQIDERLFQLKSSISLNPSSPKSTAQFKHYSAPSDNQQDYVSDPVVNGLESIEPSELSRWQQLRLSIAKNNKPSRPSVFSVLHQQMDNTAITTIQPTPTVRSNKRSDSTTSVLPANKKKDLDHVDKLKQLINMRDSLIQQQHELTATISERSTSSKTISAVRRVYDQTPDLLQRDREKQRELTKEVEELKKQIEFERNNLLKIQEQRKLEMKTIKQTEQMHKEIENIKKQQAAIIQEQQKKKDKMLIDLITEIEATRRLKCLKRIFSLWHHRAVPRLQRMKTCQSRYQWKIKSKAFCSLKRLVEEKKSLREHIQIQKQLLEQHKKEAAATKLHRSKELSRYFIQWLTKYKISKEKRLLSVQHERRKQKMENFLEQFANKIVQQEDATKKSVQDIPKIQPSNSGSRTVTSVTTRKSVSSIRESQKIRTNQKRVEIQVATNKDVNPSPVSEQHHSITKPPSNILSDPVNSANDAEIAVSEQVQIIPSDSDNSSNQENTDQTVSSVKKPVKSPAFLLTMEQREKERKEKREQLQLLYKEKQLEREKRKKEEEERAIAEDSEKKRILLEEKRREKQLQIQKIEEKEQKRIELEEKNAKAYNHYRLSLMKYQIWIPLKKLVAKANGKMVTAEQFHEKHLKKKVFQCLRLHLMEMREQKQQENHLKVQLLQNKINRRRMRSMFNAWTVHQQMVLDQNVEAEKIYRRNTMRYYLIGWKKSYEKHKEDRLITELEKESKADEFAQKFTLRCYFSRWQEYVEQQKDNREKNQIGLELKSKVRGWLDEFRSQNDIDW
jgi:hypothetical protein